MHRFSMSTRAVTGCSFDTRIIGQQWNAHDIDRWLDHVFANDDPACGDMPEVQAWAVDADQDGWAPCGAPNCGELCHAEKWLCGDHAHCDEACREESIVTNEIYADSQEVQELVLSIEEDVGYEPESVEVNDELYPVDDESLSLFDDAAAANLGAAKLSDE